MHHDQINPHTYYQSATIPSNYPESLNLLWAGGSSGLGLQYISCFITAASRTQVRRTNERKSGRICWSGEGLKWSSPERERGVKGCSDMRGCCAYFRPWRGLLLNLNPSPKTSISPSTHSRSVPPHNDYEINKLKPCAFEYGCPSTPLALEVSSPPQSPPDDSLPDSSTIRMATSLCQILVSTPIPLSIRYHGTRLQIPH